MVPTDTVYGLACLPELPAAVATIFELKGRPDDKPLPVLARDARALEPIAEFDTQAAALAQRFWPGPLTLVLRRAAGFDHDLGGNDTATVAVRVPENEVALALLEAAGPLAVTSANLSGASPATTADEARAIFGDRVPVYLDGGPSRGLPSTVVSLVGGPRVLREGALSEDEIFG